jgi:hypothetical protein
MTIYKGFRVGYGFNTVIYEEDRSSLAKEIKRLRSMRGQLTPRCRTLRKEHEIDLSQCRTLLRQLRCQLAAQEQQIVIQSKETEKIISSESKIRANLFREMIDLAKPHTIPRNSKNLYYAAIVILFRSRSTYEFLRTFLPFPSPRAVYSHFWVCSSRKSWSFVITRGDDRLFIGSNCPQPRADRRVCLCN